MVQPHTISQIGVHSDVILKKSSKTYLFGKEYIQTFPCFLSEEGLLQIPISGISCGKLYMWNQMQHAEIGGWVVIKKLFSWFWTKYQQREPKNKTVASILSCLIFETMRKITISGQIILLPFHKNPLPSPCNMC